MASNLTSCCILNFAYHWIMISFVVISCDQAALWMVLSVFLSVRLSVRHTFFTLLINHDRWDAHAKGQSQRSKVKVTEFKINFGPIWMLCVTYTNNYETNYELCTYFFNMDDYGCESLQISIIWFCDSMHVNVLCCLQIVIVDLMHWLSLCSSCHFIDDFMK